jgi:hypothetical protein
MRAGRNLVLAGVALALCAFAGADAGPPDAETAAWWATTGALAGDDMEGRDTGSAGYDRAAAYVAGRFEKAGLKPAGEDGGWMQPIDFEDVEVVSEGTSFAVVSADGQSRPLRFLHEIAVTPGWNMAERIDAPLVFRGYCRAGDMTGVEGAVVVCFGTRRAGQPNSGQQVEAATAAGAVGLMRVDDMGFSIEPPRWPLAYARSVVFASTSARAGGIPLMRLNAEAFPALAAAAGKDGAAVLAAGARGEAMQAFDVGARLQARFAVRTRHYASPNVIGVLPGTDPALANEPVLLVAHLDGYGYGTPVEGDRLYNGALDDAAYVATLISFADRRHGRGFRRPVIFAAVTGEEKGLLGSRWLAAHPTPGAPAPVAVLNLDQLRPLYPLTVLTTIGLEDSTLGQAVREVAGPMGIRVRADLEPERNLLRRTDHWPFWRQGVPGVSFLFGFDADDAVARARYDDWYRHRYHAPQDDMGTPIDFQAQADFHRFWFALVEKVADADERPQWLPDSPNRPAGPEG